MTHRSAKERAKERVKEGRASYWSMARTFHGCGEPATKVPALKMCKTHQHDTIAANLEALDRDVAALTFAMRRLDSARGFF